MAKFRTALIGPAILFAITVGIFWKLVLTRQFTWLDNPDMVNQVLPWYQFQAVEWHRGIFPQWDPYFWGGQSLIGQGQPGAAYPLNWILFLLPLKNGFIRLGAMNWYFVLIHYMGALFCYWLCRDLQRSRAASILAGVAFGLSGYCGNVDWPQMLNGAVWAPVVFLFLLRAMRGETPIANAALSGAALGVSFLSGHHQAPIFISLAVVGAWISFWVQAEVPRARIAGLACVFALMVALTSGLQILPIYQYGKLALRWVGAPDPVGWDDKVPYLVHSDFSFGPLSILGVIIPRIYRHVNPFMGLAVVSLAFLAIVAGWREPMVRFFGGIAAGGLLFALGANDVFHGVLYSVTPVIDKARVPAMAILIFNFGLAVLAAYGLDLFLLQPRDWVWTRRLAWILSALAAVLFLGVLLLILVKPEVGFTKDEASITALAALLFAGLLAAWRGNGLSNPAAGVLLILLAIFEIGNSTAYFYPGADARGYYLRRIGESGDIADFLRQQPFPVRTDVNRDALPFNWGDWYGLDEFEGYCGVTRNVIENHADALFRKLFAINFRVDTKPSGPGDVEVFRSSGGLNVYREASAFDRLWTVHQVRQVPDSHHGMLALHSPGFDAHRETYVPEAAPELEVCAGPDKVRLLQRGSNRLSFEADMGCRGMVIASETFFPGWEATVDGAPAHIYEAFTVIRGVVVGGGRHRVEMRYRPLSVEMGGAMTASGLALALAAALIAHLRRSQAI